MERISIFFHLYSENSCENENFVLILNSETSKVKFMKQLTLLFFFLFSCLQRHSFSMDFPLHKGWSRRREKYTAPTYKKGEAGIEAFIQKNFRQSENRERVDGKIIVAVIADAKGKPVETHMVRSLTKALDEEAVRVCRKMRFKPATLGKKKVKGRIDITFPIQHGRISYVDLPTIEV